jgi:hypothetical protein
MVPVGTNGLGEPRYHVSEVQPGSIARFGIDDDMMVLVIANFPGTVLVGGEGGTLVEKPVRRLVYFGCFYDAPNSYERDRLMQQDHGLTETLTVLHTPEYT